MTMSDRHYFARRAMQEMQRAQASDNPLVIEAHMAMQRAYVERAAVGDRSRFRPQEIG